MSKIQVSISDKVKRKVNAEIKDGLAIHRTVLYHVLKKQFSLSKLNYTITHVESGWCVMNNIDNKEDAIKLREKFLKLTDWTKPLKPKGKIIKSIAHEALKIRRNYFEADFIKEISRG